jgi:hypothetical protein
MLREQRIEAALASSFSPQKIAGTFGPLWTDLVRRGVEQSRAWQSIGGSFLVCVDMLLRSL